MVLSNPFRPDPRVLKEASTLAEAGYRVSIVCWDRQAEFPIEEDIHGFTVHRIRIASGYSAGSRQILYLPRFWREAVNLLEELDPDIVHCHDLDTAPIGYWFSRRRDKPWIFDAHESYPEQIKPQVSRAIYLGMLAVERFLIPRANAIITVGSLLAERLLKLRAESVTIVGNYQVLDQYSGNGTRVRSIIGIDPDAYVVGYIGGFSRERVLTQLVEAATLVCEMSLLLAGDGVQRDVVEAAVLDRRDVHYVGWVASEYVADYVSSTDVIFYGLRSSEGNSKYSSPNALFNALAAAKPIICTNTGEIAQIVREEACGLVVDGIEPELLAEAITTLQDADLRSEMGARARKAAELRYNWDIAKKGLLNVYEHIS